MNAKIKTTGIGAMLAQATNGFGSNLDKAMENGPKPIERLLTGPAQLASFSHEKRALLAQVEEKESALQAMAGRVAQLEAELSAAAEEHNNERVAQLTREVEQQQTLRAEQEAALRREIEEIQSALDAVAGTTSFVIPISKIVRIEGRRRSKSPEEYAKMKHNIDRHGIGSPVVVRQLEDGTYELIAGYNRVAIWEELGHTLIKATLQDVEVQKAKELGFFDNFIVSELPHFQKYLGLVELQKDHFPNLATNRALAEYTGENEQRISDLMVYRKLPQEVLDLLMTCPHAVNFEAAIDLVKLVKRGRKEQVIAAVRAAVESKGTMPQNEIVSRATEVGAIAPDSAEPEWFRAGERNVFSLKSRKNSFSIKVEHNVNKNKVEAAIRTALANLAAELTPR